MYFCFWPRWNNWNLFSSHHKQLEKWRKKSIITVFRNFTISHYGVLTPEKKETNKVNLVVPPALVLEAFSRPWYRLGKSEYSTVGSLNWRVRDWRSGRLGPLKFVGQDIRAEGTWGEKAPEIWMGIHLSFVSTRWDSMRSGDEQFLAVADWKMIRIHRAGNCSSSSQSAKKDMIERLGVFIRNPRDVTS